LIETTALIVRRGEYFRKSLNAVKKTLGGEVRDDGDEGSEEGEDPE
jgi:hypothetical protein